MSRLNPAPDVSEAARNAAIAAQAQRAAQQQQPLTPPLSRQNSHASVASHSSSGSSHSSHSSHQERQREQHLGEAPGGPPSVARGIAAAIGILLFLFAGQAVGLWLFTRGFLLTRTTLEGVSTCPRAPQHAWSLPRPSVKAVETDQDMGAWESALLSHAECTLPPAYKRTFLWIIDALRYDFVADAKVSALNEQNATTWTPNPHYHNVLSLPAQLHHDPNAFSILVHSLADAPTTTLQRLKGLTTGSLPTFIDAGSNFGGSAITEDNWLAQLRAQSTAGQHAKMGFAGDDTWLTVFPEMFDADWRHPFDSFNVEDLDGVDRGVAATIETYLDGINATRSDWKLLVAHTLGVDHVGHRIGASQPRMREKLLEMQDFLRKILQRLPEDSLFVLMGDHGMDERGDHGGDGELEVGTALWMYAKGRPQSQKLNEEEIKHIYQSSEHLFASHRTFSPLPSPPFDLQGHRSIAQIDFVPSTSLLLGLPIAFNNLGSIIPEAFGNADRLLRALRINALQIKTYLDAYSQSSSDLAPFRADLKSAWHAALRRDFDLALVSTSPGFRRTNQRALELDAAQAYMYFNRLALTHARSVWAKFEYVKITLGLIIIILNVANIVGIKRSLPSTDVELAFSELLPKALRGAAIGGTLSVLIKTASLFAVPIFPVLALSVVESASFGIILGAQVSALKKGFETRSGSMPDWSLPGAALPVIHAMAFSSNSFTFHESKVVLALSAMVLLSRAAQGYVSSPNARLKVRIPYLATIACIALRIASYSHVCREEEGPTCQPTFYADDNSSLNSPYALFVSYLIALGLPTLIERSLATSRSNVGIVSLFLAWIVRPALLGGSGYWIADWVITSGALGVREGTAAYAALDWAKLAVARADFALMGIIGLAIWLFSPLCLELARETVNGASSASSSNATNEKVVILGFANSFGSSYILFVGLVFAVHYLFAQAMGQVVLGSLMVAILACLELGDAERDVKLLQRTIRGGMYAPSSTPGVARSSQKSPTAAPRTEAEQAALSASPPDSLPVSMLETSLLALIGYVAFFTTGHQATFVSIQWRTAFVGFRTLQYPFSPLFVIINSFGPLALLPAITVPLLVLWNLAPKPRKDPKAEEGIRKAGETRPAGSDEIRMPTTMHILQASLSFIFYFTVVTLGTAIFATHFRRHLMLFKIWTPRFMLSAASIQLVYIGLVIGLLAAGNVMSKVAITFGSHM